MISSLADHRAWASMGMVCRALNLAWENHASETDEHQRINLSWKLMETLDSSTWFLELVY
jgi:hypothetical protein